jgi:hypothetical protein
LGVGVSHLPRDEARGSQDLRSLIHALRQIPRPPKSHETRGRVSTPPRLAEGEKKLSYLTPWRGTETGRRDGQFCFTFVHFFSNFSFFGTGYSNVLWIFFPSWAQLTVSNLTESRSDLRSLPRSNHEQYQEPQSHRASSTIATDVTSSNSLLSSSPASSVCIRRYPIPPSCSKPR